ncbi:MAG: serine hydrolase domain-containing protein, partial [Ginsengibacter sp.]
NLSVNDSSLFKAMPVMAQEVIRYYKADDKKDYFDNLFRYQLAANQYQNAILSLDSSNFFSFGIMPATNNGVRFQYRIYAIVRQAQLSNNKPFIQIYTDTLAAMFSRLSDDQKSIADSGFAMDTNTFRERLKKILTKVAGQDSIDLSEARTLVRTYNAWNVFKQILQPGNAFLAREDAKRYIQPRDSKLLKFKLDSVLSTNFKETDPGGSVLIKKGNKVLYSRSFGLANQKTKERFTPQTISNIGSISKTFVAYGILILQSKGKLSIEDSILKFFPDFKNTEIARKVKIIHLLTHTSGLPDNRNIKGDSLFYLTAKDEENFAPLKQTDTLEFEPGSKWNYSNPAYDGLALIIEKVSGMKWQTFIKQQIYKPSGMSHSKITDGPYPQNGVAHGYRKVNNQYEEYDYGEYPTFAAAGNGGIWSSVEELEKYVIAMNKCLFINCKSIAFSQQVWHPANWSDEYAPTQGVSWFVFEPNSLFRNKYKLITHSGGQGGFKADLFYIPEPDITIIWLANNDTFLTPLIMGQLLRLGYLK